MAHYILYILVAEHMLVDYGVVYCEELVLGVVVDERCGVLVAELVCGDAAGGHFVAVVVGNSLVVEEGELDGI